MKKTLILAALLASTLSLTAKTFEGYVHMLMKSGRDSMNVTYAIKDDRMRMEMSGKGGYASIGLFDPKAGEVKILMPQQKMYMSFPISTDTVSSMTPKDIEIEETGRTQEIAGYSCSEFILKSKKETIEVWATDKLGRYVSMADIQKSRGKTPSWAQVLMDRNLFPLLMITKNRRGKELVRMEAQKVEPQSLDEELFQVPEGYSAFALPGLGGLLKGIVQ